MRLPAEIRNEVYRLVLLTENVATDEPNSDGIFVTSEDRESIGSVEPREVAEVAEVAVGTIRTESSRIYTLEYQIAILFTNRQIYREAWGIFHLENTWTVVCFNKTGIVKEIKGRGFPVATADNLQRYVKFPVMKVAVVFPSLEDKKQSDTLVVATVHLKQLVRVLWTAKGASEMEVTIDIQPQWTKNSPDALSLLRPFLKLRSIKRLIICGVSETEYIEELTDAVTTTDGINQSLGEMAAIIKRLQRYVKARRMELVVALAAELFFMLIDCENVYDSRMFGDGDDVSIETTVARNLVSHEIMIDTAMVFGEITFSLGQPDRTICFADQALDYNSYRSSYQHLIPMLSTVVDVVHPCHQLPPLTGTITSRNETKCSILLMRARGYMAMGCANDALRDIESAREIMPDSTTLAGVSGAWEIMFGPVPGSAPPLPSSVTQ